MTQVPSETTAAAGPGAAEVERPATRTVAPGSRLGRYEVLAAIGEGGMATVFRARDPELRREVAIKVLFPHLARRADVVARFQREARAAARLRHPAILQTFDVGGGEGDEPPYIVMELVRGQTLAEHLAEHGPPLAEVVAAMGVCLAEALAVAHEAGVIHRDLKPGNLLVADDGRLLLADFGVAHVERDESLATRTGAVLGTPAYMSPEQAVGDPVDVRSDLYSLGATLYHLATGAPPYAGSMMKVLGQLATPGALPPADKRRPAVGRELAAVLQQLMAHEPAARPAGARQAAALLRPLATQVGEPAEELAAYWRAPAEYLRARTPEVVRTLVAAARVGGQRGQWASALGLADRALALAPEDEVTRALAEELLRRSRGGRRRAWVAAMSLAVCAGGVGVWWAWPTRAPDSPVALAEAPAAPGSELGGLRPSSPTTERSLEGGATNSVPVEREPVASAGSSPGPTSPGPPSPGPPSPAGTSSASRGRVAPSALRPPARSGAAPRPAAAPASTSSGSSPASTAPASLSAAGPGEPVASDKPQGSSLAAGTVTFAMDAWCELSIDGAPHGRADARRAISLAPGRHEAECSQGAGLGQWRGTVDVAPGQAQRVAGQLRAQVTVVVDTSGSAVLVDGQRLANGAELRVHNGRHRVSVLVGEREREAGWVSIPRVARCVLRDKPVLDCYPPR